MNTTFKKTLAAGVAALTLALAVTATSTPAAAWGKKIGPGAVFGLFGGLVAGAIIAGASHADDDCYMTRQPVYDGYGNFLGMQPTRVCD